MRLDGPVFLRLEAFDFAFTLTNKAQCRRLHAAGRKAPLDLFPQKRRQIEANEIVERASCLLGVDQIHRHFARGINCVLNGTLGDFVEHNPVHGFVVEDAAFVEDLEQVPGDGLPFAVKVSREEKGVRLLHLAGDLVDLLLVALDELVSHLKAVFGVDGAFLGQQIAHVSVGSKHLESRAQIFFDGVRLRRRLNDYELQSHTVPVVKPVVEPVVES